MNHDPELRPAPMSRAVTVVVTAGNEEDQLEDCLSTATWADQIVVVDSGSQDRSVDIARGFTERVFIEPWRGYIGQKQFALEKVTTPWVLFLDADERITPELRDSIRTELGREDVRWHGFAFPRRVYYMGRWIRHGDWYPDYKLRLFHRESGRVGGIEPHDKVLVDGPVKRLRGDLLHFTYDDLRDQVRTLNRFSEISANHLYTQGASTGLGAMLLRPAFRFLRSYVVRMGFLDGVPGFAAAVTVAYGVFLKYAKLYEMGLRDRGGNGPPEHPRQ